MIRFRACRYLHCIKWPSHGHACSIAPSQACVTSKAAAVAAASAVSFAASAFQDFHLQGFGLKTGIT